MDSRINRAAILLGIFTGIVSLLAVLLSFPEYMKNLALLELARTPTLTSIPTASLTPTPLETAKPTVTDHANLEIVQLRADIDQLRISAENSNLELEAGIKNLDKRIQSIEEVILENPARALQSTILKNEVDSLKVETQKLNNIFLAILGLIFTLAASVVLQSFSQRKSPQNATQDVTPDAEEQLRKVAVNLDNLHKIIAAENVENKDLRELVKRLEMRIENTTTNQKSEKKSMGKSSKTSK